MGAGQYPAGARRVGERAGCDPTVGITRPQATQPPPPALAYDVGKRAYTMNADGTMLGIDPTDADVALLLGIERGTIASAATFGQRLRQVLDRVAPQYQQPRAAQEVARVLKPLTDAGRVQVIRVVVDTSRFALGVAAVGITYANLTLQGARPRTVWI